MVAHTHDMLAMITHNCTLAVFATLIDRLRLNHQVGRIDTLCVSAQVARILTGPWQSAMSNESRKNVQAKFNLLAAVLQGCLRVSASLRWFKVGQHAGAPELGFGLVAQEDLAQFLKVFRQEELGRARRHGVHTERREGEN